MEEKNDYLRKYYVLMLFRVSMPSVIFCTNIKNDAYDYAKIVERSDDNHQYVVVENPNYEE